MLIIAPKVATEREISPENSRTWWASAEPALDQGRDSADCWRVFINLVPGSVDGVDRHRLGEIDVLFTLPGSAAVDDLDGALRQAGFLRASEWELGSGRGLVCWLDVAPLEA